MPHTVSFEYRIRAFEGLSPCCLCCRHYSDLQKGRKFLQILGVYYLLEWD